MYTQHASIVTPPDDAVIWRDMNLERLLAFLVTQSLYMCRLDRFTDPWEGVWPRPFVEAIRNNWPQGESESFLTASTQMKRSFFVSCWHESSYESAALWDQYGRIAGFALRTTVGCLKQSLVDDRQAFIGRVKYIDFETDDVPELNMLIPPFLKRKSFEHEREVRVMIWYLPIREGEPIAWGDAEQSFSLKTDLQVLTQELYLSPTLPAWVESSLKELLARFGLSELQLIKSDLYAPRLY